MPTLTTNYSFNKPLVNDPVDEDLWGGQLNTNFDTLDSLLGARTASKYGALIVQNNADNGFDTVTSQGAAGTVLVSAGADALPVFIALYPVGTIYMNKTVSTNPNTLFGFGTWTAITDTFIVAHGSTYTSTGGAATVTLSEANLAAHKHKSLANSAGGYVGANTIGTGAASGNDVMGNNGDQNNSILETETIGSSTPFSIIPPYQAVYVWERTA
ncbi:hypothetical protein UFOVP1454_54 [uncultured Caudovirales phage]|uniref:Baseplate structural protein Gp10 C-terminal domain-containing protein n=1 Tax=uncultured Caudovirales phage TaxID=2100421 RepID=A0A6J5SJJ4_9CAUD|nr:hypothetical protein UFOVP1454_54 [uncultured Caudovirales phage]